MLGDSSLGDFQRRHMITTLLRALVSVAVLVGLYYVLPIEHRPHQSVALRLTAALVLFVVVLVIEVRQISKHDHPTLRAGVAMATIIPLFLVLFAWVYLTMSASAPGAFGGQLGRTSALYFTVTVFSTVGFGDITPKSDPARIVAMVQMISDLAVVGIVIRLILGAATRGLARVTGLRASDDRPEGVL